MTDLNDRFHAEIALTVPLATYEAQLRHAELRRHGQGLHLRVDTRQQAAWVVHRLMKPVLGALAAIGEGASSLVVVVRDDDAASNNTAEAASAPPADPPPPPEEREEATPSRPGFPSPKSNWTRVPDFYFTFVMPSASPTCTALVAAIVHQTLGATDKLGNFREWWPNASYTEIMAATGIKSKASVTAALEEARRNGWIKRRANGQSFDYAIRWDHEPTDWP